MNHRQLGLALRVLGIAIAVVPAIMSLSLGQTLLVAAGIGIAQIGVVVQYERGRV